MELLKEELIEEELVKTEEKEEEEFIIKDYEFPYEYAYALIKDRDRNKVYSICLSCGEKAYLNGYYSYGAENNINCECKKSISVDFYTENDQKVAYITHVSRVKYNKRYFEVVFENIGFVATYNKKQHNYDIDKQRKGSEVIFKIEIEEYKPKFNKIKGFIKTKEFDSNGACIKEDEFIITKQNLIDVFDKYKYRYRLIDFIQNVIKLGITPYSRGSSSNFVADTLWDIYTNYRRYSFLIENDLGGLTASNLKEKDEAVIFLKNNPFYFECAKKEVNKRRENCLKKNFNDISWGGYSVNINEILNDYPSEDLRYYDIFDFLTKIEEDENYNFFFGHRKKDFALNLLKCGYTDDEIKDYLDACSRQAYQPDYMSLVDTYKICEIAKVPIVKIPREMHVFYRKMDSLDRFTRKFPACIDIIKTAFKQKNGQDFLDRLMYYCYKDNYFISITKRNKVLVIRKKNKDKTLEVCVCFDKTLKEISIEEAMKLAGKGLK